jgi:hypothetical protein
LGVFSAHLLFTVKDGIHIQTLTTQGVTRLTLTTTSFTKEGTLRQRLLLCGIAIESFSKSWMMSLTSLTSATGLKTVVEPAVVSV